MPLHFYRMYDADSKVHLINHFKWLQNACKQYDAEIILNCKNFLATVNLRNSDFLLYPLFLEKSDTHLRYTTEFNQSAVCFLGWRDYPTREIDLFSDKILLKEQLLIHGLLTPSYSTDINYAGQDVIIKKRSGSFGEAIYGPYKYASDYPLHPEEGEFFEQLIKGKIIKLLYSDNEPIYLEVQKMPTITGNGRSTIAELAQKRAVSRGRLGCNKYQLDEILSYQDKSLASVLANKEEVWADFRYESDLAKCHAIKELLPSHPFFKALNSNFDRIGDYLFAVIQQHNVEHLFYTVDAILDDEKKLWILEVNANPAIYPAAYPKIIHRFHQAVNFTDK
jgi:hypothetical protein